MEFCTCFSEQLKIHPSMQYQDAIKLCYQAALGAEHLLFDVERARAYLYSEFDLVSPTKEPLFEMISPEIARVNLGAWKREGRDIESLFEVFRKSLFVRHDAEKLFVLYLETAQSVMERDVPDFEREKWNEYIQEYLKNGLKPIHHSDEYRASERPSYRIVKITELEKIL